MKYLIIFPFFFLSGDKNYFTIERITENIYRTTSQDGNTWLSFEKDVQEHINNY